MKRVAIYGASGFAGAELLRLCAGHPELDVAVATGDSQAGERIADLYPSLAGAVGGRRFEAVDPAAADGLDLAFLCLPHGASQALVPELIDRVPGWSTSEPTFRLTDAALYPEWYGEPHTAPELLGRFAFGIPELFRSRLAGAPLIAAPGCYVTTAALTLAPLVRAGAIEPTGIIVDAASGVSGAGRPPKPTRRSARSTRTSPPTACSGTATPPRWSRRSVITPASMSSCCSRRIWPR